MTDLLAKKDGETYLIITKENEVLLAKQVIKGHEIIYEDIFYHDLTKKDVHLILHQDGSKGYKLIEETTGKKIPLWK